MLPLEIFWPEVTVTGKLSNSNTYNTGGAENVQHMLPLKAVKRCRKNAHTAPNYTELREAA